MNQDQPLDAWLAEVRQADSEVEVPPGLEARTLAAWDVWRREQRKRSFRRSRVWARARAWQIPAFAGIAAALLATVTLVRPDFDASAGRRQSDRERAAAAPIRSAAIGDRSSGLPAAPVARASGERGARPLEPPAKRRPRPRPDMITPQRSVAAPPPTETASFVALGPDVERELTGTFQIARVRVSRDVLVDLGLLQDGHPGGEPLQADVVFGEDGLARAIRLTPATAMSERTP